MKKQYKNHKDLNMCVRAHCMEPTLPWDKNQNWYVPCFTNKSLNDIMFRRKDLDNKGPCHFHKENEQTFWMDYSIITFSQSFLAVVLSILDFAKFMIFSNLFYICVFRNILKNSPQKNNKSLKFNSITLIWNALQRDPH